MTAAGVWGYSIRTYKFGYEAVRDPSILPRRQPNGWLLEAPSWLRPGWAHINAAGLGTGGARRRLCARETCRDIALRRSDYCRHHDVNWRRKRLKQLRRGTGKPPTPTELIKLFRADAKALWSKSPWQPLQTIWFSPTIEAAFIEDCRRAGFDPVEIAPGVLDTLCWSWRRSVLDRNDDAGWQRALIAARKHQARIGAIPEGYLYQPPSQTPPDDLRIKKITRRATAFELGPQTYIDRTTKAKARRKLSRERSRERKPPSSFDAVAFLALHWRDLAPIFTRHRLDPDSPIATRIAAAYRFVLEEQKRLDGAAGPAFKRWQQLLRELS